MVKLFHGNLTLRLSFTTYGTEWGRDEGETIHPYLFGGLH